MRRVIEVPAIPFRVSSYWVSTRDDIVVKSHLIPTEPVIRLGIVGADVLGSAGERLVAASGVVESRFLGT